MTETIKFETERIKIEQVEPAAYKAMLGLGRYLAQCGLDKKLLSLIKVRASQINRCAFCIDMHAKRLEKQEKPNSVFMLSTPGKRQPFSLLKNEQH